MERKFQWSLIGLLCFTCSSCAGPGLQDADGRGQHAKSRPREALIQTSFDTGILRGSFRFGHGDLPGRGDFPGVAQCLYLPLNLPLVNETPPNALLMPEWILKPGGPRDGVLWRLSSLRTAEEITGGVRLNYLPQDLEKQGLRVILEYRVAGDLILLDGYVEATRAHEHLEILFASYIPNSLNATYVPAGVGTDFSWIRIPRGEPWKSSYMVASSPETLPWRRDGRVSDARELDWDQVFLPEWTFAHPILVALDETTGLAAVHFVDETCTALVGQPHDHDSAHDFTWGWAYLRPGEKVHARAAVWITQLEGTLDQQLHQVYEKYQAWRLSRIHADGTSS